jgi:hypothetical protein
VTALGPRRSDLRLLGLGACAFLAGILPWRIWTESHGIRGDFSIRNGLSPSFLADHAGRVWPSVQSLYSQLVIDESWLYVVPLGGALALVCLFVQRKRSLAAFYLATGALAFAALVWVYWISATIPLGFYLGTSAYRVVSVLTAVAFAALLQLASPTDDRSELG